MTRISWITLIDVSAGLSIVLQLVISITGTCCSVVTSFEADMLTAMIRRTRVCGYTISPISEIRFEKLVTRTVVAPYAVDTLLHAII